MSFTSGVRLFVGDRVRIFGTISGDSGEVNVWYDDYRIRR